jgi:hypothetical protein
MPNLPFAPSRSRDEIMTSSTRLPVSPIIEPEDSGVDRDLGLAVVTRRIAPGWVGGGICWGLPGGDRRPNRARFLTELEIWHSWYLQ